MAETFTCAMCGKTYDKEWTDEEAMAEAEGIFGDQLGDDPDVVCDDCFNKMGGAVPMQSWADAKRVPGGPNELEAGGG
jgi:hypothetical protein